MKFTYMLVVGVDQVISRAKQPSGLDFNEIPDCATWAIHLKGTDTLDDGGEMHELVVVSWKCDNHTGYRIIQSEKPEGYCEGCNEVINATRHRLQELHNSGRAFDFLDMPAIRVIPYA
jgi:hypothetical protein